MFLINPAKEVASLLLALASAGCAWKWRKIPNSVILRAVLGTEILPCAQRPISSSMQAAAGFGDLSAGIFVGLPWLALFCIPVCSALLREGRGASMYQQK
ncbi:hypothetical protein GQ54DRAFT_12035 [Martensiomyces pterosporus]|nr:hypothetical protein GQ54DRAFT_12035 [Martensiomyces pterosporus]